MTDDDNEFPANGQAEDGTRDETATLIAEVADLKDRLLRALADGENTRRRADRDKKDTEQYAVTKFARDMLLVADNFNRALQSCPPEIRAEAAPGLKAVLEGVEATERQLLGILERHGVKTIETENARFDPHLHQAIAEVPAEGRPAGTIVNVVQNGYVIADRLLRPAMVTIARAEPAAAPSENKPGDGA
jgi:molecular chaperone GrpE